MEATLTTGLLRCTITQKIPAARKTSAMRPVTLPKENMPVMNHPSAPAGATALVRAVTWYPQNAGLDGSAQESGTAPVYTRLARASGHEQMCTPLHRYPDTELEDSFGSRFDRHAELSGERRGLGPLVSRM
jgi:hypothetical protein